MLPYSFLNIGLGFRILILLIMMKIAATTGEIAQDTRNKYPSIVFEIIVILVNEGYIDCIIEAIRISIYISIHALMKNA